MHDAFLVILLFFISFNVGMAYSTSAFQRYFELHSPKTDPNKKTSKPTITQSNIIDDTGAAITEKTSKSNVSDVIGKGYKEIRATTPPSPFWRSGGFSSETHLTRFSSPTIMDNFSIGGSTNGITTSTIATSKSTFSTETPVVPSSTYTKKSKTQKIGCTSTCGSCTETTPLSGVIKSPNYPNHYYLPTIDIGYMYCQYTINVPPGNRIHLVFQELNIAYPEWSDFLEVIDKSPDNYGKILATFFAGDNAAATMTSGESMVIYFEANPVA